MRRDGIVDLLIYVVILFLVFGGIFYVLVYLLPLPHPFGVILQIVVGVIFVVFLLSILMGLYPFRGPLVVR